MKKVLIAACALALAFAGGLYLTAEEPEQRPASAAAVAGESSTVADGHAVTGEAAAPAAGDEPLFQSTTGGCSISLQCDHPPPYSVSCSSPNPDCGITPNGRCLLCDGEFYCCAEEPPEECFPRKCLNGTACSCHAECGVGSCLGGLCNCLA